MAETQNLTQDVTRTNEVYKAGKYLEAAIQFRQLVKDCKAMNVITLAGEMANNASVSYLQAGDPKNALAVLDGVAQVFEKHGETHKLAVTLGNEAACFEALDQKNKAADLYQKAAEIFAQEEEFDLYQKTIQSLSALQLKTGFPLEALTTMKVSLDRAPRKGIKNRLLKTILDIPFKLFTSK